MLNIQKKVTLIHCDKNIVFLQPCSYHVSYMIHVKKMKNLLLVVDLVFCIECVITQKTQNWYEQSKRGFKT